MVKIGSGEDGNGGMAGFGRGLVSGLVVGAAGLTLVAALEPLPAPLSENVAAIAEEPAVEMQEPSGAGSETAQTAGSMAQAPEGDGPDALNIQDRAGTGPVIGEATPLSADAPDMDGDEIRATDEAPDQPEPSRAETPPDLATEDVAQGEPAEDDRASLADTAPPTPPALDEIELPVMPFMAGSAPEDAPKVPGAESPIAPAGATAPRMQAPADRPQGPPSTPALPVEATFAAPESGDEPPAMETAPEDVAVIEPRPEPQSADHAKDEAGDETMPSAADRVAEDAAVAGAESGPMEVAPPADAPEDAEPSPPADSRLQADFGRGGEALTLNQPDAVANDETSAPDTVTSEITLQSDHAETPQADADPNPSDAGIQAGQPLSAPPAAASTAGLEPAPPVRRGFPAPDLTIPPMLSELLSSPAEGSR